MDDVAVYGYITASKTKIILALSLSDTVVKDAEVVNVSAPITFPNVDNLNLLIHFGTALTS
jgi:hypothetical protein